MQIESVFIVRLPCSSESCTRNRLVVTHECSPFALPVVVVPIEPGCLAFSIMRIEAVGVVDLNVAKKNEKGHLRSGQQSVVTYDVTIERN